MATFDQAMDGCAGLAAARLEYPFDAHTPVWKVAGKMFAFLSTTGLTLKADPDRAEQLRRAHEFIRPGYHMNKRHWITVTLAPADVDLVRELIEDSFDAVCATLPRRDRPQQIRPGRVEPAR